MRAAGNLQNNPQSHDSRQRSNDRWRFFRCSDSKSLGDDAWKRRCKYVYWYPASEKGIYLLKGIRVLFFFFNISQFVLHILHLPNLPPSPIAHFSPVLQSFFCQPHPTLATTHHGPPSKSPSHISPNTTNRPKTTSRPRRGDPGKQQPPAMHPPLYLVVALSGLHVRTTGDSAAKLPFRPRPQPQPQPMHNSTIIAGRPQRELLVRRHRRTLPWAREGLYARWRLGK